MSWIGRIKLLIELASVEAVDKHSQSTLQRVRTTRETTRRSCQPSQVMPQFGVVCFYRIGVRFPCRDFISAEVIPQLIVDLKCVTVILLGLGRFVHHRLNVLECAFPDHFTAQITAGLPVYNRDDVDPVFLLPMKVNSSSISAAFTSLGTGVSGKLAARALTHKDTVR